MRSAVAVNVVEFQKARLWAPVAVFVDESAASSVALVHRSLHRIGSFVPLRGDRTWSHLAPGFPSDGEAFLEYFRDEHIEGHLEHLREIPVGNAVTEEVLRLAKLVAERARRRERDRECIGRERCDDRSALLARRRYRHRGLRRCSQCELTVWILANGVRHRRSWRKCCRELLDLALRLACRQRPDLLVALFVEMRNEDPQPGQMNRSGTQRVEHSRYLPRGSRDEDPVEGRALGEIELPHAERDHRRRGALPIDLPRIDFAQVEEKLRLDAIRFAGDLTRRGDQIVVVHHGHSSSRVNHSALVPSRFSSLASLRPASARRPIRWLAVCRETARCVPPFGVLASLSTAWSEPDPW